LVVTIAENRRDLTQHARAIVWAQWRTLRNSLRRSGGGIGWMAVVGVIWYGLWGTASYFLARLAMQPGSVGLVRTGLPPVLLLVFLYWQVVPLLMAATGASLDLRKLQAYPIPFSQLFGVEVLLRVTAGIEMLLVLTGVATGMLLNPLIPWWAAFALLPYVAFNLFLSVGLRDLLVRILARKRVREAAFFVVILLAALPQLVLSRAGPQTESRLRALVTNGNIPGTPWNAAAMLANGESVLYSGALLLTWTVVALWFGRWQFTRTLRFDMDAARSGEVRASSRGGLLESFYRLPSALLRDPLGALVEKELRFLARSPRFRLVFLMGFTFGLVIWLPMAAGRGGASQSVIGSNYLTVVSVYSLLLLSEVCFWNSFGFDRSAAQFYFLAPIPFSRVLIGKNISAMMFISLEILAVTAVCAVLGMPISAAKLLEAYSVAAVISVFLLGAGNLMSVNNARGTNPSSSFRSSAAGRVQAILFVVYPIAFLPAALAYLARWAFKGEWALYAVLAVDMAIALIVYRVALDSAVAAAEKTREKMLTALSAGDGPITG
jgi:ABC-2 type transport system permease protein